MIKTYVVALPTKADKEPDETPKKKPKGKK